VIAFAGYVDELAAVNPVATVWCRVLTWLQSLGK
jgi:hypothetical protein